MGTKKGYFKQYVKNTKKKYDSYLRGTLPKKCEVKKTDQLESRVHARHIQR